MSNIIEVYPLWQRGRLLLGCDPITIKCDSAQIGTLRPAWLVPQDCQGGEAYVLEFSMPEPFVENTLQGIWMRKDDGDGIVLNSDSILRIAEACSTCCSETVSLVAPVYPQYYQIPMVTAVQPIEMKIESTSQLLDMGPPPSVAPSAPLTENKTAPVEKKATRKTATKEKKASPKTKNDTK
jgi:hypothetical protein